MSQVEKKVKVINNNPFTVGIKVNIGTPKSFPVKAKSFVYLTEDEVQYINSTSRTFREGFLTVEDPEVKESMGEVEKNPNSVTDEEIEKILKGNFKAMEKSLKEITAQHAINRVVSIAKDLDLTAGKLKLIKEVLNVDIFEEVSDDIV